MQRLDGHWVAKRVGILDHYKGMTLSEIVLFDAYLLLANKQTWECWRTIRQLEEILPMNKYNPVEAHLGKCFQKESKKMAVVPIAARIQTLAKTIQPSNPLSRTRQKGVNVPAIRK